MRGLAVAIAFLFSCQLAAAAYEEIVTTDEDGADSSYDFTYDHFVIFRVKTCGRANITLHTNKKVREDFVVVIGSETNPRSYVAVAPGGQAGGRPGSHTDCDQFKRFMVTWDYWGSVRLYTGEGKWVTALYRTIDKAKYQVNKVTVSVEGGVEGEWQIEDPNFSPRQCCNSGQSCILPGFDCRFIAHSDPNRPNPSTFITPCALGTQFDTERCTMDHADKVECNV